MHLNISELIELLKEIENKAHGDKLVYLTTNYGLCLLEEDDIHIDSDGDLIINAEYHEF